MALSPAEDAWRSLFFDYVEPVAAAPGIRARVVAPAARPFSFFRFEDQRAALALADEFDSLAGRDAAAHHQTPPTQEQLAAVMQRFHEEAVSNVGLAKAALRFFITRWPNAEVLPIPTLREQLKEQPDRFAALGPQARALAPSPWDEEAMRYFRQDIDLSDHHSHWHALYPAFLRDPSGSVEPKQDIQGRLFLYMHQQMLARYDTDRLAVSLPPVAPFLRWDDTPDGWKTAFENATLPADALAPWITESTVHDFDESNYIGFDEKHSSPNQNAPEDVNRVIKGLTHVLKGITGRTYRSYNAVGADLEASNPDFDKTDLRGGPHNIGHMALATPHNDRQHVFVMANPEVAMTTPVFYRWHRAIDDFGFAWQESQGPDTTKYVTPPVVQRRGAAPAATRSPDIILTPRSAITDIDKPGFSQENLTAWGEAHFGGANFDAPVTDPALDTVELVTEIKQDPDLAGQPILSIKTDWVYFLRLRNTGTADATVTVRIWVAARALATSRRNWIEMDKFVATVAAGAKKVVSRGGWQSTVVRRKTVEAPMLLAATKDEWVDTDMSAADLPFDTHANAWCECGLPYRLLLPRGTAEGMQARFLVLLTDAQQDGTAEMVAEECGSVLYCGRNTSTWPDNQEMGFPFHRPFLTADDPLFSHFDPMPNAAWRDVSIRCAVND